MILEPNLFGDFRAWLYWSKDIYQLWIDGFCVHINALFKKSDPNIAETSKNFSPPAKQEKTEMRDKRRTIIDRHVLNERQNVAGFPVNHQTSKLLHFSLEKSHLF